MSRVLIWVGCLLIVLGMVHSIPSVKRKDEIVLYGNQQNQNHLSVKKSGPLPPLGQYKDSTKSDLEHELHNAKNKENHPTHEITSKDEEKISEIEAELPKEEEQEKYSQLEKELKDKVRQENRKHHIKLADKKDYENNIPTAEEQKAEYMKLKHMARKREFERQMKRQDKRSNKGEFRFKRARDELIRRSQEASMTGASTLVRKKRDLDDLDPEQMSRLSAYLAESRDGYYNDGGEQPAEFEFYPNEEAMEKRFDDDEAEEEGVPEEYIPSQEEDEPKEATYYEITHEGIPGLFIPYKQDSLENALNKVDLMNEKMNIDYLAEQLAANQQQQKRSYDDSYIYPVVENRK